jgi:copper chaperone CopZ
VGGALLFGTLINEWPVLRSYFSGIGISDHGHMHFIPEWISIVSALILAALIINGYLQKNKKINPNKMNLTGDKQVNIAVNGMTCGHCKNSVETAVGKLEGVEEVTVDLSRKEVTVTGSQIDLEKVKTIIEQLGYEYVGKR